MQISNIAAYKFIGIHDTDLFKDALKQKCDYLGLKGTVIVSQEGINLFLAGTPDHIAEFLRFLRGDPIFEGRFGDIEVKESFSDRQPFGKMVVRTAREIITMRHPMIRPEATRAPSVDAATLKTWRDRGHDDEGRPVLMLDTRNAFEVEIGTFNGARDFKIQKFTEFPQAIASCKAQGELEGKTIVSFCTGGIRCEKAALYMQEIDVDHVYQLDGGILKYFETVGGEHYTGECFVFDERVALDADLKATTTQYPDRPLHQGKT